MLPFFVKVDGAIAKRLCTGLQIRLAQFDSGSRLHTKINGLRETVTHFFVGVVAVPINPNYVF